jgi:hypothetical protein
VLAAHSVMFTVDDSSQLGIVPAAAQYKRCDAGLSQLVIVVLNRKHLCWSVKSDGPNHTGGAPR